MFQGARQARRQSVPRASRFRGSLGIGGLRLCARPEDRAALSTNCSTRHATGQAGREKYRGNNSRTEKENISVLDNRASRRDRTEKRSREHLGGEFFRLHGLVPLADDLPEQVAQARKEGARGFRLDSRSAFCQRPCALHDSAITGGNFESRGARAESCSFEQMIGLAGVQCKADLTAIGDGYERGE